ncbi:MAG: tetratricopeptide repeat protein [Alphaproteobacteria bacterium]|nr:tetratricopeptide repeat protein [Alphaproteobacteria bacterium]
MYKKTPNLVILALPLLIGACDVSKESISSDSVNLYNAQESSSKLLNMAERMRVSGDYQTALKFYSQVTDEETLTPIAAFGLANCLAKLGQGEEAIQVLVDFNERSPDHPDINLEFGKVYLEMHHPKKCIHHFNAALRTHPKNITVLNGLGVCYDLEKNHEKARSFYLRALDINPKATHVSANLGLSYTFTKDTLKKAIATLEPIAKSRKATAKDRQNLALAYGLSGNTKKSAQIFSVDLSDEDVQANIDYIKSIKNQRLEQSTHTSAFVNSQPIEMTPVGTQIASPAKPDAFLKQRPEKIKTREVVSGLGVQNSEDIKQDNKISSDMDLLEAEALLM